MSGETDRGRALPRPRSTAVFDGPDRAAARAYMKGIGFDDAAHALRLLDEDAFARTGNHTERGMLTLIELVEGAVKHLEHHLKFVYDKREKLGKLMW